jgi:hypothetical protein
MSIYCFVNIPLASTHNVVIFLQMFSSETETESDIESESESDDVQILK